MKLHTFSTETVKIQVYVSRLVGSCNAIGLDYTVLLSFCHSTPFSTLVIAFSCATDLYSLYKMKTYLEIKLATWLGMVKFLELKAIKYQQILTFEFKL